MQVIDPKKEIRSKLRERRNAIPEEQADAWSREIVTRIAASTAFRHADLLLIYAPIGREVDLLPLFSIARERGIDVAFPVSDPATNTITFRAVDDLRQLVRGEYGIPEPPDNARGVTATERTLCILPGLAFTPQGKRIGYGKGYYDRYLEQFPGVSVGALYERMLCKDLPTEEHDRSVSLVFTERGMIDCKKRTAHAPQKQENALATAGEKLRSWSASHMHLSRKKVTHQGVAPSELPPTRAQHYPLALTLCVFVLLILSRWIDTAFLTRETESIGMILLQILTFIIPAVGYSALRGERFGSRIRLTLPRPEHLWFCFCALTVMIFGSLLTSILTGGMESLVGGFVLYNTFTAQADGSFISVVTLVLSYVIVPAFCEELIFRAYLCAEYEHLGVGVSVIASALLFAMLHFSFPLFLTYLLLGAVLAVVLYATRSFFAVLMLHILYNLFCLFGQPYLTAFYLNAGSNDIFVFLVVVILLLFSAFAAGEARKIYHLYARRNLSSAYTVSRPLKSYPKTLFRAFLSPFAAACIAVFLIMAVINYSL